MSWRDRRNASIITEIYSLPEDYVQSIKRYQVIRSTMFLVAGLLVSVVPSVAATVSADVAACFSTAATQHNIPVELLVSIAEVESGLKPLALNSSGTTILPPTREQADQAVDVLARQRATFDVGIMQVNRWWFEKYGEAYNKGLDPCFNIDFGTRILAMAIRDHGFTWQAVGRYHSPTGWRQDAYARKIYTRLARLLEKRRTTSLELIIAPADNTLAFDQHRGSSQRADTPADR